MRNSGLSLDGGAFGYADLRVLVAEDNPVNRQLMGAMLRSAGVSPLFVGDGVAAVAEVRRGAFHLVLMDISMPIMDGLTAIRRIRELEARENRPNSLIYVVSSQHSHQDQLDSAAAGANGHLSKPLVVAQFLEAVDGGVRLMRAQCAEASPVVPKAGAPSAHPARRRGR